MGLKIFVLSLSAILLVQAGPASSEGNADTATLVLNFQTFTAMHMNEIMDFTLMECEKLCADLLAKADEMKTRSQFVEELTPKLKRFMLDSQRTQKLKQNTFKCVTGHNLFHEITDIGKNISAASEEDFPKDMQKIMQDFDKTLNAGYENYKEEYGAELSQLYVNLDEDARLEKERITDWFLKYGNEEDVKETIRSIWRSTRELL